MKTHDRLNCPACGMPTIPDDGHNTPDMALCNVCDEQEDIDPMTHHTIGPWYATKPGNPYQGLVIDERTGANIAVTYDKEYADLIASAPELLDACREAQLLIHYLLSGTPDEAHDLLVNQGEEIESLLRHAIAKAEGRD